MSNVELNTHEFEGFGLVELKCVGNGGVVMTSRLDGFRGKPVMGLLVFFRKVLMKRNG